MEQERLPERAARGGARLLDQLKSALHNRPEVQEIRGRGMMAAVVLDADCSSLVKIGLEKKVIFNVTAGNVVRLLPPYNASDVEIDEIARRVSDSITELCQQPVTA